MKRSGPPERKTPLARGEFSLRRTGPIRRSEQSLLRREPMKPRKQPPIVTLKTPGKKLGRGMDPKLRALVYRRAGGACDLCGQGLREATFETHHRQLHSQGGPDTAENLVALHSKCHLERVHGRPGWARDHGFIVPSWADPGLTPILRHGRKWQQPTGGGWVRADPIETDTSEGEAS